MVTGNGVRGGRGRCYTLWLDFMTCLTAHDSMSQKVCVNEREDYMECLHHTKLVSLTHTHTHTCIHTHSHAPTHSPPPPPSHSLLSLSPSLPPSPSLSLSLSQAKRLEAIKTQKAKLIAEGKWPPH